MKIIGFAGWSSSGKTRLITRLLQEFCQKSLRVSSMKHAHHSFDVDHKGKDSYAHRKAGAHEVLVVSDRRWALMHECTPEEKTDTQWLSPAVLQKHLAPVDVLLVEGFKNAPIDKIEVHRSTLHHETPRPLFAESDRRIRAIVSDAPSDTSLDSALLSQDFLHRALPVFDADDPRPIADFILDSDGFLLPPASALLGDAT